MQEYDGEATYSPEDNKLRLYVGRVPREEFLKLRAEGWVTLHKQREVGGGDFAAVWTPERRDTALEYAGVILDEDMGPAERAADRAERFSGYRDKRFTEATGTADKYEAGPSAHGYQSEKRAASAVRRHDRLAARSVDSWDKAEYWQQRTAGVIGHALYLSSPSVRMGRIKKLEMQLRNYATPGGEWHKHLTLRLAYENQMLQAQGGRAAHVEMIPGGWIGSKQIWKVNKSSITGRVVSVLVIGPKIQGYCYQVQDVSGADFSLHQIETERLPKDAYRTPTAEDIAAMEKIKADWKAKQPKVESIPLINPTDADAERLQAVLNQKRIDQRSSDTTPSSVLRITQAQFSANSKGGYARVETRYLCADGELRDRDSNMYSSARDAREKRIGPPVCKIRYAWSGRAVIVITDKPQKPLPAAVWEPLSKAPAFALEAETVNA